MFAMSSRAAAMLALCLLALALLLIGIGLIARDRLALRQARSLDARLDARVATPTAFSIAAGTSDVVDSRPFPRRLVDQLAKIGMKGVASSIGRQLVAEEDRKLLDTCGVNDARGQALFFIARLVLGVLLPVAGLFIFGTHTFLRVILILFFGFSIGYMLPKIFMSRYAARRRRDAADELPLLIDLLRLLQGVGLSVDQSIHLIQSEFRNVLPVLGLELEIASNQYTGGRSRELSLQRFSTVFDNEDMGAIARLLVQVDRYGGAVQEPLAQFSERIRERRKLDLKSRIGKLTVKMTGVMVITLLPALLIVTAGAGFLAIFRGFARIGIHG